MDLNDINVDEINVNQIQEIHYQRLKKRVDVFDKVLKQCYRVIKQTVAKEEQWCIYTIPEIMFGNPLYKIPDCANYIYRSLRKNGFTVKYIFPNHLVIMWSYKRSGQDMLEYPTVTQQQSGYGGSGGYVRAQPRAESIRALPAPPIRKAEESKPAIGIDILKRGAGNGGGGHKMTHSTKEFRPSGMFLFNKKR